MNIFKILFFILLGCSTSNDVLKSNIRPSVNTNCSAFDQTLNFESKFKVIQTCLKSQNFKKGYSYLKRLLPQVRENNKKSLILNNLGYSQAKLGHFDNAKFFFSESINLYENPESVYNLLLIYLNEGVTKIPSQYLAKSKYLKIDSDKLNRLNARLSLVTKNKVDLDTYYSRLDDVKDKKNYVLSLIRFGELGAARKIIEDNQLKNEFISSELTQRESRGTQSQ